MENTIYAVDCDLFTKNKIIEILINNSFYFFRDSSKPKQDFGGYLSLNEDQMWFVKKIIVLNYADINIVIGNSYREDMNSSAFQIYFPNRVKITGFNYNPEFSKALILLDDFNLLMPVISINLNKKNIDKLINEEDVTFENTKMDALRKFKAVNFKKVKTAGIKKLFILKKGDFFIVVGWILQGRKKRNTVVYNTAFTDFLMEIKSIDLQTPEGLDRKRNNIKGNFNKGRIPKQNGNFHLQPNPKFSLEDRIPINNFDDKKKLPFDNTPNIDKINTILEKITKFSIASLSFDEITFLKDNSEDI